MKLEDEGLKKWRELDKVFGVYSGGSVHFEYFITMEDLTNKTPVIFHSKRFGKLRIIIMMTEGEVGG